MRVGSLSQIGRRFLSSASVGNSSPASPTKADASLFSSDLMKRFMQKYGKVFVAVHFTVYFTFLGTIYTGLKQNVDVPALIKKYLSIDLRKEKKEGEEPGWMERILGGESGSAGTLVLAILCNKAMFFVRTPITLTITPIAARYAQRLGIQPGKVASGVAMGTATGGPGKQH